MATPPTPDTSGMGALARELRLRADGLRRHHALLVARCASTQWHSRAATACRHRVTGTLGRLHACASALDRAASALDQHARTVHERVRELEAVPSGIAHAGAGLVHGIGAGLHRATHWMGT